MARPRTAEPRSPQHAALGRAIESVIAETDGMTLDTVVAGSKLDEKQIGTFIRGQGNPTYGTLLKLCEGLHISLAELMIRAERELEQSAPRPDDRESSVEPATTSAPSNRPIRTTPDLA